MPRAGLLVIAGRQAGGHRVDREGVRRRIPRAPGEEPPLADALTVNTYLGADSVEPFLQACRLHGAGIFCLVRTSNRGAATSRS
jgi:orotidine-5'-phosphate decarboxylase